jgi:hypothetical protein
VGRFEPVAGDDPAAGTRNDGKTRGRTDIELRVGDALLIFEAKLGWNLPTSVQLGGYEQRLLERLAQSQSGGAIDPISNAALITLSECSAEWAARKLPAPGLCRGDI